MKVIVLGFTHYVNGRTSRASNCRIRQLHRKGSDRLKRDVTRAFLERDAICQEMLFETMEDRESFALKL